MRTRILGVFALGLLALAGLVGCGAKDKGPGIATANGGAQPTASNAPAADQEQRARQFAQCMRDHGVDVPDPEEGGGVKGVLVRGDTSVDKQKLSAAMEACQQYLPDGGEPPQLSAEELEKLRQFAQCMRDHGVPDWPDPDPNGQLKVEAGPRLQKDDPTLRRAMEECNDLLPQGKVGGTAVEGGKG